MSNATLTARERWAQWIPMTSQELAEVLGGDVRTVERELKRCGIEPVRTIRPMRYCPKMVRKRIYRPLPQSGAEAVASTQLLKQREREWTK